MRRLGDAAVVFDPSTWQTHVLPPAVVVIVDLIDELRAEGEFTSARFDAALRTELDMDPDAPEVIQLLQMFRDIGLLED